MIGHLAEEAEADLMAEARQAGPPGHLRLTARWFSDRKVSFPDWPPTLNVTRT